MRVLRARCPRSVTSERIAVRSSHDRLHDYGPGQAASNRPPLRYRSRGRFAACWGEILRRRRGCRALHGRGRHTAPLFHGIGEVLQPRTFQGPEESGNAPGSSSLLPTLGLYLRRRKGPDY